jgi:AraC-like DNA-binding protein
MIKDKPSSFLGNMVLVHQTLQSYGLDADEVLVEAGIDRSFYENTKQRVPTELMDQLISLSYEKTADPMFGLKVVDYLNPVNYHALGMGLLCSSSLRDFCLRFERFIALITTLETVKFSETDAGACFSIAPLTNLSELHRNFDADTFTAIVLKFSRLIYKPDYCPTKIELPWSPPEQYWDKYRHYFGCEVEFSASRSAIHLDKQDLDVPLAASNVELARQNDQLVIEFLAKGKMDLPSQVYSKLIELLPSGDCSRERVASALNMSGSAFHEKLKKAGSSYQQLLDQTRKDLAEYHIVHTDMSLTEVAFLLGFNESTNFARAFRRWFGISPREYRNRLSDGTPGEVDDQPPTMKG